MSEEEQDPQQDPQVGALASRVHVALRAFSALNMGVADGELGYAPPENWLAEGHIGALTRLLVEAGILEERAVLLETLRQQAVILERGLSEAAEHLRGRSGLVVAHSHPRNGRPQG